MRSNRELAADESAAKAGEDRGRLLRYARHYLLLAESHLMNGLIGSMLGQMVILEFLRLDRGQKRNGSRVQHKCSSLQPIDDDIVLKLTHGERLRCEMEPEVLPLRAVYADDIGRGVADYDQNHPG